MSYFLIDNFKSGLDVRKSALTAPAGVLMILNNAAISPGGEIVKRKAFVKVANLAGTFGLAAIGSKLIAFTKGVDVKPPEMTASDGRKVTDVTLEYHKLPNKSPTLTQTDYDIFDGRIYFVGSDPNPQPPADAQSGPTLPAGIADGTTFRNTTDNRTYVWQKDRWNEWGTDMREGNLPARGYYGDWFKRLSDNKWYMIQGAQWVRQNSDPTNPAAWPTGGALPSNQIEGKTCHQYNEGVDYITTNGKWEVYTPTSTGATFPTGIADGTHFRNTTDGKVYVWQTSAWVEWKVNIKNKNPHYYFDNREKVNDRFSENPDGTWEWTTKTNPNKDTYQPTEGSGMGYFVRAYKSKLYCVGDKFLRFSAVNDGFLWETATNSNDSSRDGAGYVNIAVQEGTSSVLNGVEIYYDKLALFSDYSTQIWSVVSDPKQNQLGQILRQTGTKAPWSVTQYGSGDILFIASSGIRSLKARDISNSAAVSDIGSPVDDLVRSLPDNEKVYCRSILEPVVGRVWFAFRKKIFVLSFFPGPSITAWSTYEVPFDVEYVVNCGTHLYVRSGDDLYLYGGVDNETYDDCPVEVRLPFLDGGKPGHMKMFQGVDATVTGEWDVAISYDPDSPDHEEPVAKISAPTWNKGRYELTGYAPHMSLRFYCNADGPASISNAAIHYSLSTDSD